MCHQEDIDESSASIHFLEIQKNQLVDLRKPLELYCTVLPVLVLTMQNIVLIKPYLPPIVINERNNNTVISKKAKQNIVFKFDDIPVLENNMSWVDMLRLGCTLSNFAKIFLQKSSISTFHPFTDGDKHPLEKIKDDSVSCFFIVFICAAVVNTICFIGRKLVFINHLFALMLVNFTCTHCVNLCQNNSVREAILGQEPA